MCEFALGAAIGVLITALEHEVGATAVLVIMIVDQESRVHTKLVQFPAYIPRLLGDPGSVWPIGHREPGMGGREVSIRGAYRQPNCR